MFGKKRKALEEYERGEGKSEIDTPKESFIDRHQLWPFYRRRRYSEETMEEVRSVWREIEEGYTIDDYPDAVKCLNFREPDFSKLKYRPVLRPKYVLGRERMADGGYDLGDLDYVVQMLCRGDKLPPRYGNHKLKGKMKGYTECHIAFDWALVYRYSHRELILYAINTGTHEDVFGK